MMLVVWLVELLAKICAYMMKMMLMMIPVVIMKFQMLPMMIIMT